MSELSPEDFSKRIAALESELNALRGATAKTGAGSVPPLPPQGPAFPPPLPPPLPPAPVVRREADSPFERARALLTLENILSKLGIGLLILGMILLLKYSIDQGWFTPWVRVGIGIGVAAALWTAGWRLTPGRAALGQMLAGGGLAVWHATMCAAVQLYSLFSPAVGFLFILGGTLAGFGLALSRNVQAPAVVALAGGLAAPFLLDSGRLDVVPVVVYGLLLLGGGWAAYHRRGWPSLFWTGLVGGVVVFAMLLDDVSVSASARMLDRFALQVGLVAWLLAHAGLPVARLLRRREGPEVGPTLHVTAFAVPALFLTGSITTWDLDQVPSGCLSLGLAGLYLAAATLLGGHPAHRRGHRLAALLLAVAGVLLIFEGDAAFFVCTALALVLIEGARRTGEAVLVVFGHLTAAVMAVWWMVRMTDPSFAPVVVRMDALTNLAAVAVLFWVWLRSPGASWRWVYWVAANVFLLGWTAREASATDAGMAWTSAGWGVHALVLLVASVVRWDAWTRRTGIALLVLVVAKLIVIDLSEVEAVWRVILFCGLGALMLLVSYALPRLAGPPAKASGSAAEAGSTGTPPPLP